MKQVWLRKVLYLLLPVFWFLPSLAPADDEPAPDDPALWFNQAKTQYDRANFKAALALYQSLFEQGFSSAELFFNMGNTHFKLGQLGQAILFYRRAAYLNPRDADIKGNFGYAIQSAGAVAPTLSPFGMLFSKCTKGNWIVIAVASYWIAAMLIGVLVLFRKKKEIIIRSLAGVLILFLLSIAGIFHWVGMAEQPEIVTINTKQKALYAPLADATAHFELPIGSVVRMVDRQSTWIKVRSGKKIGWIREDSFSQVYPW